MRDFIANIKPSSYGKQEEFLKKTKKKFPWELKYQLMEVIEKSTTSVEGSFRLCYGRL